MYVRVEWDLNGEEAEDEEEEIQSVRERNYNRAHSLGLPDTVEVPAYLSPDDISDYITDAYGRCVVYWNRL